MDERDYKAMNEELNQPTDANIEQEFCRWQKGDKDFSQDQIVLLKTYEILLEISNENIEAVMDKLEELYIKCA